MHGAREFAAAAVACKKDGDHRGFGRFVDELEREGFSPRRISELLRKEGLEEIDPPAAKGPARLVRSAARNSRRGRLEVARGQFDRLVELVGSEEAQVLSEGHRLFLGRPLPPFGEGGATTPHPSFVH